MKVRPASYIDWIAWALAETQSRNFSADPVRWHRFVLRASEEHPDLFKGVTFDLTDPDRPYSEQAAQALHTLAQARVVSTGNPSYERLQISDEQRERIEATRKPEREKQHDVVVRLAEVASELLSV
jgi:hypothetical protein